VNTGWPLRFVLGWGGSRWPGRWSAGLLVVATGLALVAESAPATDQPNAVNFAAVEARYVRFVIQTSREGEPCLDELEVYGPAGPANLALAATGAKATASSCLPGYSIHQVSHLNDGLYGNDHSWIAAGARREWAQIELPRAVVVDKVVFSRDRQGRYRDRLPAAFEVRVSLEGQSWNTVARHVDLLTLPEGPLTENDLLRYAFACEDRTWRRYETNASVGRVLRQLEAMLERFAAQGLDVDRERAEWTELRRRAQAREATPMTPEAQQELYFAARLAKRRLFLRAPDLAQAQRILFVKRHPYEPSHNYSVILDAQGGPGGGICVLEIPQVKGRLEPGQARLSTLFDAKEGLARDPVASFDARTIYFGYRSTMRDYFHLWMMRADGGAARPITAGAFHDYFPCPLPDGGLAFISTRCRARFLCWRPQAFVLFRMDANHRNLRPLSHANLSEWTPSLLRDGRIVWMRSEYIDKGADFGHTLWAIRPDGTQPELIFGNNTLNCYADGREVPGTGEFLCTLVSHGGDLNGPLALVDAARGRFNPQAIRNLTPDVQPHYHMSWARQECFRDPYPISRDYFLCSHAPADRFGLYVIDRWGNRELLYLDPERGSMSPSLLRAVAPPPVIAPAIATGEQAAEEGQFLVADVYRGLEPKVPRGAVKYIRVCQEVRADLLRLADGQYQRDHEAFEDWYATPTHKVRGPHGWPSYVAKGDLGLAPVEPDGSAHFYAPAGKVLYFEVLDERFNELQRMRSVVQLQPGEKRGCVGCHEDRATAPPFALARPLAARRPPSRLARPPWGAGPFAYERVVQPVWDAQCIRCHHANDTNRINLTATLDADGVPASFRTVIERGWVHYFDYSYSREHNKAEPLSFGTLRSRLWQVLEAGHYGVRLTEEEARRVKTWTDLNCPLWPDYTYRLDRPGVRPGKAGVAVSR
jgi:hypothetical protein